MQTSEHLLYIARVP